MKQKLFTLFLALVASVGTLFALSGTCGTNLTWELTDGVLTISGSGAMTNWSYKSDVPWYWRFSYIKSVTIGDGVTSIGQSAFSGCSSLTNVTIGNSVTCIKSEAFEGCSSLTSIEIPNSVTSIEYRAFGGCSGLTSVIWNAKNGTNSGGFGSQVESFTFGNEVESIPASCCSGMNKLTSIIIPNSVTSIGDYAFSGCSSLTSIDIPNSVTSLGSGAFRGCSGLTSVVWNVKNCHDFSSNNTPFYYYSSVDYSYNYYNLRNQIISFVFGEDVEHIPAYLCEKMTNLTSIEIPNSVTSIGGSAFDGCSGLTSVIWNAKNCTNSGRFGSQVESFTFGNEVESIPESCCYGMNKLTSIIIPNSVTSIGDNAFSNCSGLTSVTIPNSVTSIGSSAFNNVPNIVYSGTATGSPWSARNVNGYVEGWLIYSDNTKTNLLACSLAATGAIEIPNSVTSIGNYAFDGCTGLTSITIPNSVTSIGNYAFDGCTGLTSITIPNSVTSIGNRAFENCSGLTSITIPNSVTSIEYRAFGGCSGLTSIEIPNSVTRIGNYAFYGCSGLTSVVWNAKNCQDFSLGPFNKQIISFVFGEEVEHIPAYLCYQMTNLTSVEIPNSVTSIGEYAFSGCSGLTSATIGNSVTSIGYDAFYNCRSLTSATIGNSVTSIGDNAFSNCSGLTSIIWNAKNCTNRGNFGSQVESFTFGNEVESIPESCCSGMNKLTSIIIPNSVTSIGEYAFSGCSGLTSATIGNSVTSIGYDAFYNCRSLTSIEIPNSVTSIGGSVFSGCSGLTSIEIPNSVTSIGYDAFCNCSGLTSIEIPNSVTSIVNYAFRDCSGLTSVTIGNSVTSIGVGAFSGCSGLTSVIWNAKNGTNNGAFGSQVESFTFGNEVESIPVCCCYGMNKLTSIIIPNSVTSIGDNAFSNCSGLTSIIWNAKNCTNRGNFGSQVESFTFGNEVESIPASCCSGMNKLTFIEIPNSVTSIGGSAFSGCSGLTGELVIPNSVTSIGDYAFYNCSGLTSVTIPNSVTSIEDWAFSGCKGLTSVIWNAQNCSGSGNFGSQVESFTFGNKVKSIPASCCSGMKKLTSIEIPNSVTSIGKKAFYDCKNLEKLSLGENITTYGDSAFTNCTGLTSIYNYRKTPAKLGTDAFKDVDYFNCTLYVLAGSVDMYKSAGSDWKNFYFVEPISAEGTSVTDATIIPSENSVVIEWPEVSGATVYIIQIWKGDELICTLSFNAQGQLLTISLEKRAGNGTTRTATQTATGWQYTIDGLEANTEYTYTIIAKNGEEELFNESISFTTTMATTIDEISTVNSQLSTKILRNGQIFILRSDKTYTITGQEVR